MNVLLSGGCKSGKTACAQTIALRLAGGGRRCFAATMQPRDAEDRARIARHVRERAGMGFETLEVARNIGACAALAGPDATVLLDSVTALLAGEMFPDGAEADIDAVYRCRDGLLALAAGVKHTVFVTDHIYSDAARYDALTERYRASLAYLERTLAAVCDTVIELCAGTMLFHKGGLPG